jgi:acyl dehydratase
MNAPRPLDVAKLRAYRIPSLKAHYDARDAIIYALGCGAGLGEIDETDLLYEKRLKTLPTMAVVLGRGDLWCMDPDTGLDWPQILHAGQRFTLHQPMAAQGSVSTESEILEISDKGPGKPALIAARRRVFDPVGGLIADIEEVWIVRGAGGFGGERAFNFMQPDPMPDRAPELSLTLPTAKNQALLYRLSGDLNPLHVEPEVSRLGGFDRPVLHGLSTMGLACRALTHRVCGGDPSLITDMSVRFTAPVWPGETIRTDVWTGGDRIRFRAVAVERGDIVLDEGSASLNKV